MRYEERISDKEKYKLPQKVYKREKEMEKGSWYAGKATGQDKQA
jgi:hypothetical protein